MARGSGGPSIRMVANEAGVSVATVSNVLNGKANVAPELVRRVHAAIEALGYVRDNRASRLRSGVSRLVGVIVPDLTNPMFAQFVSTLELQARDGGYDLVVVSARNDPAEEAVRLAHLREWRPAGLIIIPVDGALEERLPNRPVLPMVVADRIPDTVRFDLIAVDNAPASAAIASHLASQGYPDCLVAGTTVAIANIRERWEGAIEGAGNMRIDLVEIGFEEQGTPLLERRLRAAERPSAIYCLDHNTTFVAYRTLRALDLEPGSDIGFATFDEMEWMRLVTPGLTAVRQPFEEMAEYAWSMLRRRMGDDASPAHARRLRCTVTFRASTPRLALGASPAVSAERAVQATPMTGHSSGA